MDRTELLPCPFCGGEVEIYHDTSSDYERHWSYTIRCPNQDCGCDFGHYETIQKVVRQWNTRRTTPQTLLEFYNRVCDRAEANMTLTGTVSGAHWNAMRQELKAQGIEVTR